MIKDSDTIELTSVADNTPELKEVADNLARNVMLTKATNNDLQKLNTAFFTDEDGAHIRNDEGYQTDLVGDAMIIRDQNGNQVARFSGDTVLGDDNGDNYMFLDEDGLVLVNGGTPNFEVSDVGDVTCGLVNGVDVTDLIAYTTVTDNGWTIKKFADGTYEGHKTETRSIPITTAWGSMWRSLDQTVTAPALSTSIDFYTVDCNYPGTFCTVSSFYTLNWTAFSSTSETATRDVRYYIRGRWD